MGDQVSSGTHTGRVTSDSGSDHLDPIPKNNLKTDPRSAEDLMPEILLWSSVKNVLRFRCVSKSLCAIIDSNHFINQHCNRSVNNTKHRKLISRESLKCAKLLAFEVDSGLVEEMNKPFENNYKPYGYCNGLILLLVDSLRLATFKLALWNPSTHKYRYLPSCPIIVPNGSRWSVTGMGSGYDSTRDEYKVVVIQDIKTGGDNHVLETWIFELRSNSWRRIQDFPYGKKGKLIYFGYFVDGCLHWMCKRNAGRYALVTFDVAKETISSTSYGSGSGKIDLHVLDGCLCMSFFSRHRDQVMISVRKKVESKFKWIRQLTVTRETPPLFDISRFNTGRVLGYTKEGDRIMLDLGFKFIVLYDLKRGCFESKRLAIDIPKKVSNYPFLFHESLVSVGSEDMQRQSGQKRKSMD